MSTLGDTLLPLLAFAGNLTLCWRLVTRIATRMEERRSGNTSVRLLFLGSSLCNPPQPLLPSLPSASPFLLAAQSYGGLSLLLILASGASALIPLNLAGRSLLKSLLDPPANLNA